MNKTENRNHSIRVLLRQIFKLPFLFLIVINCSGSSTNTSCTECAGGLIDGFLYKQVTVEDLSGLSEIDIITDIEKCIRFKLDGTEFSEAEVVEDCCCVEFQ